jgi:hypothetical protein
VLDAPQAAETQRLLADVPRFAAVGQTEAI